VAAYVLGKFSTQTTLKDFPLMVKQKLLNYLGYAVPLDETATALPTSLVTPNTLIWQWEEVFTLSLFN
jgi:type IV pilus assembly protein PilY1